MPQLRLLASSLAASAFALQAAAQAPATPAQLPSIASVTIFPSATLLTDTPKSYNFNFPKDKPFGTHTPDTTLPGTTITLTARNLDPNAAPQQAHNALDRTRKNLSAQTPSPCYTLRSYSFTPQDLKSTHPHASSETDCTPASSARLKPIEIQSTKK
jgi:hypothetical protein